MNIKVLGSGQEVGRSSIILEGEERLMMDCGVKVEPSPPSYPEVEKVDTLIISHAHLDHIGAVPLVCKKNHTKIFMNDITLELGTLLIRDSVKVARKEGFSIPFGNKEIKNMLRATKLVGYMERFHTAGFNATLWPSGHIPGSSSVMVEFGGKKIFYTSDIQTSDSRLLNKCSLPTNIDILIIESTYGLRDHKPREFSEKEIIDLVGEALDNGEPVLFPVFAVGRAQEVMMVLEQFADKIVLDGMARKASEIISDYGYYLRDQKHYRNLLDKVKFFHRNDDRSTIFKRYPIIISSAGMLSGGPAVSYLREISGRTGSKVIFAGFLADDTPGKNLVQTNIYKSSEEEFEVKCDIHQFELSAHTDRQGLYEIIETTRPNKIICVHGENCDKFAKEIESRFGIQSFAPRNGEIVSV